MTDSLPVPHPDQPSSPASRRGRWSAVAGLVLLAGLLAAGVWYHLVWSLPGHLRTVTPGVLYRSAWPTADQLAELVARYQIRTVVNLCLPDEEVSRQDGNWDREERQCRELGVSLVHFPLPGNTPPNAEQVREWLRLCQSPEALPVLVHCAQGVIRTNGLVAVYRIGIRGADNETVLHSLPDFGHDLFSPKRARLNDFILAWRPDRPDEAGNQDAVAQTAGTSPPANAEEH